MTSSELADIASAAAQAPGRLGVCYQNRLNPTRLRIRKELAESIEANSVHGSDSDENAKIEIDFFFKPEEIVG